MNTKEWALILFTILGQMSVGSFLVLGIVHFFAARKHGKEQADKLSDRALLAIWPVLALALVASLFHLGNPINAPRAITNLNSSWLSREILATMLFFGLGLTFSFMQWRKIGSTGMRTVLSWATALVGIFMVYAMSQVYRLAAQPAWNTLATPVMFYAATFLLGSLAVGAALVINYARVKRVEPECAEVQCVLLRDTVRGIAVASLVLLGVEVVTIASRAIFLAGSSEPVAASSAALYYNEFSVLFILRLVLVFIGAGVFALLLYRNALNSGQEKSMGVLLYSAFAMVLTAEVLGRFMFYATHIKIGL